MALAKYGLVIQELIKFCLGTSFPILETYLAHLAHAFIPRQLKIETIYNWIHKPRVQYPRVLTTKPPQVVYSGSYVVLGLTRVHKIKLLREKPASTWQIYRMLK